MTKYLSLLYGCVALSAAADPCSRLLTGSVPEIEAVSFRTPYLTPQNIANVFAYEYAPGKRGAKALSFLDSEGTIHVVFWPLREGDRPLHHSDVFAALLDQDVTRMQRRIQDLETRVEGFLRRRLELKRLGASGSAETNALMMNVEALHREMSAISLRMSKYRILSRELLADRLVDPFDRFPIGHVQGFELSACIDGQERWRIDGIAVSSLLNNYQDRREQSGVLGALDPTLKERMIASMREAIDPELREHLNSAY